MLDLLTDETRTGAKITHALACWDGASKNDKQRAPKPSGYYEAMQACWTAVAAITGMPQCCCETEAEDQVATAAYTCASDPEYKQIVVVSGDKDVKQLAGMLGKVRYYCLNTKDLLTERIICNKYGVTSPGHIGIALAIQGDKADNIDGVPGWGIAKVKKLFKDVDPKADLAEVAERILAQIPTHLQEHFLKSLELTVLSTDVPGVPAPAPFNIAVSDVFYDHDLVALSHYGI